MEVCPYSYFWWCGYFWGPWGSFVMTNEFSVMVTKLLQGLVSHELTAYPSVFNLILTQWIRATSKVCKPDDFEPHNSPKLSFKNTWGLHSTTVECESFLKSNSPGILALIEINNLDDSIDSGIFSVRSYLTLIWKDSITHMHGLAVYVKKGLLISRKLCGFLHMFSTSITASFPLSITFSAIMHSFGFYFI